VPYLSDIGRINRTATSQLRFWGWGWIVVFQLLRHADYKEDILYRSIIKQIIYDKSSLDTSPLNEYYKSVYSSRNFRYESRLNDMKYLG